MVKIDRLVEFPAFKRSIDEVYSQFVPKGSGYFVFASLEIAPDKIDVNVHPTKQKVHVLNEDRICQKIAEKISEKLQSSDNSRVFYVQTKLSTPSKAISSSQSTVRRDNSFVRVDSKTRTLDDFIQQTPNGKALLGSSSSPNVNYNADSDCERAIKSSQPAELFEVQYSSCPESSLQHSQIETEKKINAVPAQSSTFREIVPSNEEVDNQDTYIPKVRSPQPNDILLSNSQKKAKLTPLPEKISKDPFDNEKQCSNLDFNIVDEDFSESPVAMMVEEEKDLNVSHGPSHETRQWVDVKLNSINSLKQEILDQENEGIPILN
jgi:DNA mismatch repair ATPase MutL